MFSLFSQLRKLFGAKPLADEATDSIEAKSVETTQTDTSYSKEVGHQQPPPAPTWAIPLCGPLLSRLLSKNDTSNTTTNLNAKGKKDVEKDDFVIINPFTEDESSPEEELVQTKEKLLCDFDFENRPGGGRKFVMDLTKDLDEIVDLNEIMFLVNLLETLRDGVAMDAPMRPSTRFSGDMIKVRAARWADKVGEQVDEYLKVEKEKVERIRKKAEDRSEEEDDRVVWQEAVDRTLKDRGVLKAIPNIEG